MHIISFSLYFLRITKGTAPTDAAPRHAVKKINCTVYHSRGYTVSFAALRSAAPRNESWEDFIFHGAAFFGVALWPIAKTRRVTCRKKTLHAAVKKTGFTHAALLLVGPRLLNFAAPRRGAVA